MVDRDIGWAGKALRLVLAGFIVAQPWMPHLMSDGCAGAPDVMGGPAGLHEGSGTMAAAGGGSHAGQRTSPETADPAGVRAPANGNHQHPANGHGVAGCCCVACPTGCATAPIPSSARLQVAALATSPSRINPAHRSNHATRERGNIQPPSTGPPLPLA